MQRLVQFGKCLSDPLIVRILLVLVGRDLKMFQLEQVLQQSRPALDVRLNRMRQCGLVDTEPDGRWLRFHLAERHRDLVRQLLHEYEDELQWDLDVTLDAKRLRELSSI
jgi:DNA-binding transcriptional ArsR family regulator